MGYPDIRAFGAIGSLETEVDQRRRSMLQIETLIADFDQRANGLEREIKAEQNRVGIHDPAHIAYPTYARAAIARRENLRRSVRELRTELERLKSASSEHVDIRINNAA